MKKNAIILNLQGGIINEIDLDKALNDLILGAALDVFVNEPISLDNPLLKNNKVLLNIQQLLLMNAHQG